MKKTDEEALKDAEKFVTETNKDDLQKKYERAVKDASEKFFLEKIDVKGADGIVKKVYLEDRIKDLGVIIRDDEDDVTKIADNVRNEVAEKEKKLNKDREAQLKKADESSGVKDAQKKLDEYKEEDEYKNRTVTPVYKALAADGC